MTSRASTPHHLQGLRTVVIFVGCFFCIQHTCALAAQVIAWLWETVHGLAPEEQRKFLKFVSGSDRAPIGGLANLRCMIQVGP